MKLLFLCFLLAWSSAAVQADMASDLEHLVGFYIHSSYDYPGTITGGVFGRILELGSIVVKITEYSYIYEYYPTIVLLYNPKTEAIKLIVGDEVLDAMVLQ